MKQTQSRLQAIIKSRSAAYSVLKNQQANKKGSRGPPQAAS